MSGWDVWKDPGKILADATALPKCVGEYSVSAPTTATTLSALIDAAVTATTIAPSSPTTLALSNASFARIAVETNDVRVSYFGNTSTNGTYGVAVIGELLPKGATYPLNTDPTKIVIAAQTASATLRISLFA